MIYTFNKNNIAGIQAVPEPKFVWHDIDRVIVYTGADIPSSAQRPHANVETVRVPAGRGTHEILMRQEILLRNGGGVIEFDHGGKYTIDQDGIEINYGAGVGIRGNASWLDARTVKPGKAALTMTSHGLKCDLPIEGSDTNVTNYHQKRVAIEGFSLVGDRVKRETDGIDLNVTQSSATRSQRAVIRHVNVQGFNRGIRHRNYAYLAAFMHGGCFNCNVAFSYEGGDDQGENTNLFDWHLFNSGIGLLVDTQPETGVSENIDLTFGACSLDYNKQQIVYKSGHGRVRFNSGSYFEWNYAGPEYPFEMGAAASNRLFWLFDSPNLIYTGSTRSFPSLFRAGDNHDVRVERYHAHNIAGAGVQLTPDKSSTGGPTLVNLMAHVTGTGRFKADGITDLVASNMPRVPTFVASNNWLADGGFEEPTLADMWYVAEGGIGTLARTTTEFHRGTASLQCPITSGANTTKQLALLVPRRGRFVGVTSFLKLSAGSGSVQLKVAPAVCRVTAAPGALQTPQKIGPITELNSATLSAAGWVGLGQAGNQPRYELPEWATHLLVIFDMRTINNNGGNVYIDDVHIETW